MSDSDRERVDWIREHLRLYDTDPERAHMWDASSMGGPGPVPTLVLTTVGRRSKQARRVPLIYGRNGDALVVIASKGGALRHPAWYLNLASEPRCRIQVASMHGDRVARVASGDERRRLWSLMCEIHPDYRDYERRATSREIPVVVLDPADGPNARSVDPSRTG